MKVLFSPRTSGENIHYHFEGQKITIEIDGVIDSFDFTDLPDGELDLYDAEGKQRLKTNLSFNPIRYAEKKDGVLWVRLLKKISNNASYEDRFPEWIDVKDYAPPKEVEPINDEEIMEERRTN